MKFRRPKWTLIGAILLTVPQHPFFGIIWMDSAAINAADLKLNPPLNSVLEWVLSFKRFLIRMGLYFHCGGSMLLLAKKA